LTPATKGIKPIKFCQNSKKAKVTLKCCSQQLKELFRSTLQFFPSSHPSNYLKKIKGPFTLFLAGFEPGSSVSEADAMSTAPRHQGNHPSYVHCFFNVGVVG
jgi:hypothetical protein